MNGVLSEERLIQYGVPLGSILGPLIFVVYINYLPNSLGDLLVHLYADDTVITVTANHLDNLEHHIFDALNWTTKSHLILTNDNVRVNVNGTNIKIVKEFKYLGVILDPKLTFSKHAEYITCYGLL